MRVCLLALLFACGGEEPLKVDPNDAEPVQEVGPSSALDDQAYEFCHRAGADAASAKAYCDLLKNLPEDRCPGLRDTCAGAEPLVPGGCNLETGAGARSSQLGGAPVAPTAQQKIQNSCDMPDTAGGGALSLMRWVMAIVVALLLLVFIRFIMRHFATKAQSIEPDAGTRAPTVEEEEQLPDVPNLPSADLLTAARTSLEQGDFGEAVLLARGAALRSLGKRGVLRIHRAKTDREYVGSVRKTLEVHTDLREIVASVEVHRWGGQPIDRDLAQSALAAAERLLKAGLMALFFVGIDAANAQETRHGPNGDAALYDVLEDWGHTPRWRLRGLTSLDEETDVLVLDTTFISLEDEHWEAVRDWVEAGGVLWLAGDSDDVFPELGELTQRPGAGHTQLTADFESSLRWGGFAQGVEEVWTPLNGTVWVAYVSDDADEAPRAVIQSIFVGSGVVFATSDPRILWNGSFVHPDNEAFVGDALFRAQSTLGWPRTSPFNVELATSSGSSDNTPPKALAKSHLLPFLIQMMATWGLVGLWLGRPFGPLRDPPGEGRLAFTEHINALATHWMRLGATRHALAAYAGLWLTKLGPRGLRMAARKSGMQPGPADEFVQHLEDVVADPTAPDDDTDLSRVETLWKIISGQ
ncbi:MAG: DUF4129 domain-containing protein [Rhodobacterales bacterium]|nr:DUF4129 domain-containing protein [Rhodobacterales bacterium]